MAKKSRVVQVGCGGRGQAHLKATLAVKDIDLVALCDTDKARLDAAVNQFGFKGRTYSSMPGMLKKEKYDVVDIITPPTIRVGIVEEAVSCGAKAILIEKPIALRPSEARRLAAIGKNVLIGVNTQYQWMPHWQKFWKLLAAN